MVGKATRVLLVVLLITTVSINKSVAQSVGINTSGAAPNQFAILDVESSTMGMLIPRMTTTDRSNFGTSLGATEEGMTVYDLDTDSYWLWDGAAWVEFDMDATNEYNTVLNLSGTTLELTDGGGTLTQDLSSLGGTDDQNIFGSNLSGNILEIGIENGTNETVDLTSLVDDADADPTNEYNTGLTLSGTTLELTDAGGTLTQDLSSLGGTDDQNIMGSNLSGNILEIGIENGTSETVDLTSLVDDADADPANEYNTGLTLSGTTLEVTDGGGTLTQDLSSLGGTDDQNIMGSNLSGNILEIGIENGTNETVDLTSLVDDADADPTNEYQDLGSTSSGTTRTITITNGTNTSIDVADGDSDPANEYNTSVNLNGTTLEVTDGGGTLTQDLNSLVNDTDWAMSPGHVYNVDDYVMVGTNTISTETRMEVDYDGEDIAIKANGMFGPTHGYLGVQGATDFDGITTADWTGDEIGVAGISTGGSSTDNFGVRGHSNGWGGRFEHETSGNFVEAGGGTYALRVVDGNEAAGKVLTSDAAGNATWQTPSGGADNDWARQGPDFVTTVDGTDSVLIGPPGGGPTYAYDFAVDNGLASGTRVGMGSVEYFEDGANEFGFYNGDFIVDDDMTINGNGFNLYSLHVGSGTASNTIFDAGTYDAIVDYDSGEPTFRPSTGGWGYLGNNTYDWFYLYRVNEVNTSLRSRKKDISELTNPHYDRVMEDIRNMNLAFYRYKEESKEFNPDQPSKYRPLPHLGTFVDQVPDYLKDNTLSGIMTDGYASMAVAGVKQLDKRVRELEENVATQYRVVEDFGSITLDGQKVEVFFNEQFEMQLQGNDKLPVITITSLNKASDLFVAEKSRNGFVVKAENPAKGPLQFDWTAKARIESKVEKDDGVKGVQDIKLDASEEEKELMRKWVEKQRKERSQERIEGVKQRIQEAQSKGDNEAAKEEVEKLKNLLEELQSEK